MIIWTLFILVTALFTSWKEDNIKKLLKSDALGYYAYLPAVFIYQDIDFGWYDENIAFFKSDNREPFDFREYPDGATINKYYMGTALASLPFFVPVWLSYSALSIPCSGYEMPFYYAIHLAAIAYFLCGLYFMIQTMLRLGIEKKWAIILAYCVLLGTNAGYYIVSEPGLSHIFSFAFISLFLYLSTCMIQGNLRISTMLLLGFTFGMICLIRPVNAIILFALPFISGDLRSFFSGTKIRPYLIAAFVAICILSLQFIYYKAATGSFFVYSYNEERFLFLQAHFYEFLWSYRKGFFVYTPLFLFLFPALIYWYRKRSKMGALFFIAFFIGLTYLFSSWWMWYYGGGLGTRVFIEFYPLFAIPIAYYFSACRNEWVRNMNYFFLLLFIYFGYLSQWQYRKGKIHWDSATKEQYYDNLFKIDHLL